MLKPKEINEVRFPKAIRGYDADEVDKFLDTVVADYAELFRENAELMRRLDALEAQINEYKKQEESLRAAKDKIYRMAQEVASKAKADAARTEQEAQEHATRIVATAKRDSEAQRRVYERLQLESTRFKAKAIALFQSEIDQLNNLPDLAVDAKDELRIRADELRQEDDALSSPFVEVYKEKHRSPAEIDFGVPEEDEIPMKPKVDLPPVDPAEDFAVGYLSGEEKVSGALGIAIETVNEPTDEIKPAPVQEETPAPAPEQTAEPVAETPVETVAIPDEPTEPTAEAPEEIVDIPPMPEELIAEPVKEEVPVDVPEEKLSASDAATHVFTIIPAEGEKTDVTVDEIGESLPKGEKPREGRLENGWYNETADFDMVDTNVGAPRKPDEKATPTGSKFTQLRFGTDYDITKDNGDSSSRGSLFKRKK